MKDIIFVVGETLLVEMEGVKAITYPQDEENPTTATLTLNSGKKYQFTITEIV